MKRNLLLLAVIALVAFGFSSFAMADQDPNDNGVADTLYMECFPGDEELHEPGPFFVRVPLYVTNDIPDPNIDSIAGIVIPLCYTHSNPGKYCSLSGYWNNTHLHPSLDIDRSIFRHFIEGEDTLIHNWMMDLSQQGMGEEWDCIILDLDGTSHFWLQLVACGFQDQRWPGGSRRLLATMTFKLEDTMTVCIDSCFWPPNGRVSFVRSGAVTYIPQIWDDYLGEEEYCFSTSIAPPQIAVSPDSFYLEDRPDDQIYEYFWISNVGGGVLEYDVELTTPVGWLSIDPTSGSVPGGEEDTVTLTFNTTGLDGHYYDTLRVISNSGEKQDQDTVLVPVHLWVTGWPTFIAHFMTPEGEPYPFDCIISDGEWVQEFDSVTYIETEVPDSATYTFTYTPINRTSSYHCVFHFSAGEVRHFEFYAIDWEVAEFRTRPYILFQELGADTSLSWEWDPATLTLNYTLSSDSVYIGVGVGIENDICQPPNFALANIDIEGEEPSQNGVIVQQTAPGDPFEIIEIDIWGAMVEKKADVSVSITFEEINPEWPWIEMAEHWKKDYVFHSTMNLMDLGGTEYPSQYLIPQYAVPPGDYILECIPEDFAPLSLSLNLEGDKGVKSVIAEISHSKIADLEPYTFYIAAENPFANSSYCNLFHAPDDSITVDVATETEYDFWGCFVLPTELTVGGLFAYSDTLGEEELTERYDFTINHIEGSDLFLVVVRNEPYYNRLKLEFASRGDVTEDGVIDLGDVLSIISYLYKGGPAPQPLDCGDVNCDGLIDLGDVLYLISYLYKGGPPPCGG